MTGHAWLLAIECDILHNEISLFLRITFCQIGRFLCGLGLVGLKVFAQCSVLYCFHLNHVTASLIP